MGEKNSKTKNENYNYNYKKVKFINLKICIYNYKIIIS